MAVDPHHAGRNLVGPAEGDEHGRSALAVGLLVAKRFGGAFVGAFLVVDFLQHGVVDRFDFLPVGGRVGNLREDLLAERMDALVVDLDVRAADRVELQLAGNLLGDFQVVGFFRRQNRCLSSPRP